MAQSAKDCHAPETQLYITCDDGSRALCGPPFEYQALQSQEDEVRILTLYPCEGDVNAEENFVRCELETIPFTAVPPYIAVKNARGYRLLLGAFMLNGRATIIPYALEIFLRNFRTQISLPQRLWIRPICVCLSHDDERARYWTREWSDKMYDTASEVISMDLFNSSLIDKKIVPKLANSKYTSMPKSWWGKPNEVVLPEVYPVRLGTRPSNEAPSGGFNYVPLDLIADEIRVLVLMPSKDPSNPIILHAAHCPIKCEVTFTALSYSWGTDTTPAEIVLNGQRKVIRKSLFRILRELRMQDKTVPLWIDALSINQTDLSERNHQVSRMGEIYYNAAVVVSYVGDKTEDIHLVLEIVDELQKPQRRVNDKGVWYLGDWKLDGRAGESASKKNCVSPDHLWRMLAALYKVLTAPYFRRVWILQEVALASNPTIAIGDCVELAFERLDHATYNLQVMLQMDASLPRRMIKADPTIRDVKCEDLEFIRKLFYFRHLASKGASDVPCFATIKGTPCYLEAMILSRDFESTDPRDKIYSLWNLVQDKAGLQIEFNYSLSVPEVYVDFTRAWILMHQGLDILGAAETTSEADVFYYEAPSWCPNWQVPSQSSCLVRRERIPQRMMCAIGDQNGVIYAADGGTNGNTFDMPLIHFAGATLACTGIVLDQIKFVFDDPVEVSDSMPLHSCDALSFHKFQHWTKSITDYFTLNDITIYDDPMQAATAMMHGDSTAAWPLREDNLEYTLERFPDERYVCIPAMSRHVPWFAGTYERTVAWDAVKTVIRGRQPFVSANGYMGLLPSYVREHTPQEPLLLAVVAGCSVPLLLRERGDGSYQLYGTCFVQGWMDGEIIEVMMGTESPRDFWEAVREVAKIAIR